MPAVTGGAQILTDAQIIALWIYEGGSLGSAQVALQRALSESSGNFAAISSNPDGGSNVGLYQLDTKGVGAGHSVADLENPYTNTRITVQATSDGNDWSAWADNWQEFGQQAANALNEFVKAAGAKKVSGDSSSISKSQLSQYAKKVLKGITGANAEVSQPGTPNPNPNSGTGGWLSFLNNPLAAAEDMLKVVEFLINPLSWLRILAGMAGFVFLLAGLFMLAKAM